MRNFDAIWNNSNWFTLVLNVCSTQMQKKPLHPFFLFHSHRPIEMIQKFNDNFWVHLQICSKVVAHSAVQQWYALHRCQLSEQSTTPIQSNVRIAHASMAWAWDEVTIDPAAVKWSRHFVIKRYENQIVLIFIGRNSPINVSFDFYFVYLEAKHWLF